ncbi:hypothetical protein TrRE_jg13144 [Triparma retinervis]|uniref:RRM domain-containing protein n=1 Tax=Triparma retinervis TaxID=2557542 RepID=A0A9W7CHZ9_9STRA|nr:hypothetical protein TrRE_jg13144 [Triparma retinervis]
MERGRGFSEQSQSTRLHQGRIGSGGSSYEAASTETSSGPQRSIEGWILIGTNIHEEASEDDIEELFSDHGYIQHMTVNRDRKMGRIKSVLVEYGEKSEAQDAVNKLDGSKLLGQEITVDWAFIK